MEFFSRWKSKYAGIKGFVGAYNDAIRYQYMITEKAKKKAAIVAFFERFGLEATITAFKISKSSIYAWRQILIKNSWRIECLNERSKTPQNKRQKHWNQDILDFLIKYRHDHPAVGKENLKPLVDDFCRTKNIQIVSESTIGRMIADLKKQGKIRKNLKVSFYAQTGKFVEQTRKKRPKSRRKDYQPEKAGDLLQIDTIIKFINGLKRYVLAITDIKSGFSFAYGYSSLSSQVAKDFFQKLEVVAPFAIGHVQSDNGQEFLKNFRDYLENQDIVQFFNYPRRPQMNCYIERFNRFIQEDFIDYQLQTLAYDLPRFNEKLMDWLIWYNTQKPQRKLNKMSPLRYLIECLGFSRMYWTTTRT